MKRSLVRNSIAVSFFSIVLAFSVAAGASNIGAVVQDACKKCHSPKRICLMLGKKSTEGWQQTVESMVEKGAKVPEDSIGAAATYLADLAPGSDMFCN